MVVQPDEIIAVLLGASRWPAAENLSSEVFARSKERIKYYLFDPAGLGLQPSQVLDLFDTPNGAEKIYDDLTRFLISEPAKKASDLLLYFVGHGDFAGDANEYTLLIQRSVPLQLETTTLKAADLATVIRKSASHLNQHLLIDACFSGAAEEAFYGNSIRQSAVRVLREKHVEMLCSSGMVRSVAPRNEECTPFSSAILDVLMTGSKIVKGNLTLKAVAELAKDRVIDTFGDKAAIPKFFPEDPDSEIINRSLFPNAASSIQWCVLLSESAKTAATAHPLKKIATTMKVAFGGEISEAAGNRPLGVPRFLNALQTVSSIVELQEAIRIVCRSEFALFDLTQYEPAAMLLLGIRSVARRGVTVCAAADSPLDQQTEEAPFYFRDMKLVSYARGVEKPEQAIKDRVSNGLKQLNDTPLQYVDVPSFEPVRQLWPDENSRQSLRYFEQCLVLCSYSNDYKDNLWPNISTNLGYAIKNEKENDATVPQEFRKNEPRVIRSLDMSSPRLVSLALFDAIRRTEFCVVDFTEWRPSVLFELGVRLASTDLDPVCIIESQAEDAPSAHANQTPKAAQGRSFLKLFPVCEYLRDDTSEDPVAPYLKMLLAHMHVRERLYVSEPWGEGGRVRPGDIYRTVWQYVYPEQEPIAASVSKYLAETERLYRVSDSKGRSPFIYPKTHRLTAQAEEHGRECAIAALLYLQHRHGEAKLLADVRLRKEYQELAYRVAGKLLQSSDEADKEFGKKISELAVQIEL
jgi:Caspase domain